MTLFYLILAWLAGIALARTADVAWWVWLLVFIPACAGAILAWLVGRSHKERSPWPVLFGYAALFALGAARLSLVVPHFNENDLAFYNNNGFVSVEGTIIDAPDVRDTYTNLRVRAESITLPGGESRAVKGLVLAQVPSVGSYRYGDPVIVHGELNTPPELEDFSYREYLARQGIYSLMRYTQVEITGERRGSPIRAAMFDFRQRAYQVIMRLLPDPQASLLAGILLGIESGISPDVMEAFNAVGASHVIVISGSNLVILMGVLQNTAKRFMREVYAAALTIVGIMFYTVFVGGDAAVARAAIMVTLAIIAPLLGRQTYGPASLALAAFVLTLFDPFTLWDISFQLSALATLGLILYVEPLQNILAKGLSLMLSVETAQKVVGTISEALVVTVAAQITTTPIIVYYFGRLSLVSLLVNCLIVPAQTHLMVLGGLSVLAALVVWPVGQVLAWGSWVFLSYTIGIVRLFARLPFASVTIENIPPSAIWGIYAIMFGLTFYARQDEEQRARLREGLGRAVGVKAVAGAGLVIVALLVAANCSLPDGRLHVTFADVGPGTATLIETPGGRHILVDAGGSGRRLSTTLGDELPFWDRYLDLVILTQPTQSHTGALRPILARYRVDAVMTNGVRGEGELTDALWAALEEQGTRIVNAEPGMRITVGDGVTLTVLHTQVGKPTDEDDPGGPVVILVTYGSARILLPGDLTHESEAALLSSGYALNATVLQVPAHGNQAASSEAFLAAVNPQVNILQVDAGNRAGSPHPETLARLESTGAPLYRTDLAGTIYLTTDGARLWIRTARREGR